MGRTTRLVSREYIYFIGSETSLIYLLQISHKSDITFYSGVIGRKNENQI